LARVLQAWGHPRVLQRLLLLQLQALQAVNL
jgi:hypothetical protein